MFRRTRTTLGSLDCHVLDAAAGAPQALVVLCHGYGAPGDDLVSLAESLAPPEAQGPAVRFLFPEGPLDLRHLHMPGSRAWWHLDGAMLQQRAQDPAAFAQMLRQHLWPGLAAARRLLHQVVEQALTEAGLGFDRLILGGFSQGAMLSTDLTLRLDEPPAGLVVLSGSLVDESNWRRLLAKRSGLRVVQSHGQADPILPYRNGVALKDLLLQHGNRVQFEAFAGGHVIPPQALRACGQLVAEVLRLSA